MKSSNIFRRTLIIRLRTNKSRIRQRNKKKSFEKMLADKDAWVVRALIELKYGRINKIWDEKMLFDEVEDKAQDEDNVSDDEPLDETYDWSNFVQLINIYGSVDYKILEFYFNIDKPLPRRSKPLPWKKYIRQFINEQKQVGAIKQDASVYVMVTSIDRNHRGNVFYVAEHPTGTYEEFQYYGAQEHIARFIKAGMVRKVRMNKQDWIYGRPAARQPSYREFLAEMNQNTRQ